ncbi:MAG: PD40 domain-containing protein [Planctomycetes bacterium]|nr:PD40 domain-containing protein [Planctomycetota bacterium]
MESLSMQLQPFFEWLLRTTLQASLLICFIFLFQAVLRNKLGARWHYCLWLLLLIRMAMPWAPQSRVSVFNLIPQSLPQRQTEYIQQDVGDDTVSSDAASPSTAESTPVSTTGVAQDTSKAITVAPEIGKEAGSQLKPLFSKAADILPLVWLTGALALAVYVCASNFNLLRIVKRERPLTDQKILDLLEDCKAEMGIRIILGVVATDKVKSPALFGFIRPRLLLPAGMLETLSPKELRHVFLHELAHLKRHDIYIGWLMSLLQVLHWFNPLIWLAFYRLRADRELACDALVLARTQSGESKDYGRTIVSLLERFSRSQRLPAMAGILETKTQLKRRITMIARFKKNSYQWSPWAIVLIIILACISLPDAKHTKASGISAAKPSPATKLTGPTYRLVLDEQITGKHVGMCDFSPSGDRIVFQSPDNLYITDQATTIIRPLLDDLGAWERVGRPCWSPDGRLIAYSLTKGPPPDSDAKIVSAIFVISPDGGAPRQIGPDETKRYIFSVFWTPDGQHLTYRTNECIRTLTLDGNEVRFIPRKDLSYVSGPDGRGYSPNGRWLVFSRDKENGSGTDLCIFPVTGGTARRLTHLPEYSNSPTWAPDGHTLYFVSGRDTLNIWKLSMDPETGLAKGKPQQVTFFKDTIVLAPQVLGDGSRIAFGMYKRNTSIQVADSSSPQEARSLVSCGMYSPELSPDGQTVYYVNDTPGEEGIYAVPRQGGAPRRLTESLPAEGRLLYFPRFDLSGDGRTLAYSTKLGNEHALFTVPASGGEPRLLARITTKWSVVPQWSPDGSQLAYADGHDLNVIAAAGGKPRKLAHMDHSWEPSSVRWSPDGKFIAAFGMSKPRLNAVFVVPSSGGELRQLTSDVEEKERLEWHPDGRRLTYLVSRLDSETHQAYLDGREPTLLVNAPDVWDYVGKWAPDGRRFFFVGFDVSSKDSGVYVYDESSSKTTLVSDPVQHVGVPSWSRDGKTMAWWETRTTSRQTWIMEDFLPTAKADGQ